MSQYYVEFQDSSGNHVGGKYFSQPDDIRAMTEGATLLRSKNRSNRRAVRVAVYQRSLFVDRATHVGDFNV
jgi:hypothetical protein